jgi:aspartate racemase
MMKKIGILGGVGWASTIDYYRGIAEAASARSAAQGGRGPALIPAISIESVQQARTRALRGTEGDEDSWAAFDAVFRDALLTLQGAGCDFAVIASNTPHARLHAIRRGVSLPILSIYEATAEAAAASGLADALVLGTRVTMQSPNYAKALAAVDVQANPTIASDAVDEMQAMIDDEFHGGASADARARLLRFCDAHGRADMAIVLACTELPLAFPDHIDNPLFEAGGHLFINPSAAHIRAAVARALAP